MQFLTVAALFASAALAGRTTCVTFLGAADAKFELQVPVSGEWTTIDNPLSITYIQVANEPKAHCTAFGVDGSRTYVGSGHTIPVGPPQTQHGIYCVQPYDS
ncbi:hypothetical protein MKZ38_005026 [Zalerion maritima]|uniref:Uncharacterized protein n=1 Tax=Zalerion maritima TaxID=339359 RepID=A0AAD5WPJ0_9PEZI|nr:hypothetical protein MKZ38_005026 [Zalerion maritima]